MKLTKILFSLVFCSFLTINNSASFAQSGAPTNQRSYGTRAEPQQPTRPSASFQHEESKSSQSDDGSSENSKKTGLVNGDRTPSDVQDIDSSDSGSRPNSK